ncbi:Bacterial regulatory protein, arsR family [uncultured archaeon]|nr:Bacterial regulatory protein, arsR family [uncultured archaeon]
MEAPEEALASDTRKDILKLLAEKNHRPSDLSRELGKDKSTIVEHLETLRQAGLVERIEREGHKWIFYCLSKNGQAYFPNRQKRVIYIAMAMLSLIGAMLTFFAYVQPAAQGGILASGSPETASKDFNAPPAPLRTGQPEGAPATAAPGQPAAVPNNDIYLYAGVALLAVFLAALAQALLVKVGEFIPQRAKK